MVFGWVLCVLVNVIHGEGMDTIQYRIKNNNEEIYLKNVNSMITKKSTKAEDSLKNLNQ